MSTPSRGAGVVRPPEKGVFPLDHDGQCRIPMMELMTCLKQNKQDHLPCKLYSKAYLECRMQTSLMQQEDMKSLGFSGSDEDYKRIHETIKGSDVSKERDGFIAGTHIKKRAGGKGIFDWF